MNPPPRSDAIFQEALDVHNRRTDRLFAWLLVAQWFFAILLAIVVSPLTWVGRQGSLHPHLLIAVVFGGILNSLPLVLIRVRPGWWGTRQAIAVTQMLWSGVLIHITGGRIETHFHVFGSLAFLAFYRDWKLLPTATAVVAADHLVRGLLWPESVYGIANPEWWRFLEHAAWVLFEDIVLFLGCRRQMAEMRLIADREAALEATNTTIEAQVDERTFELWESMERYRSLVENTNAIPWEYDLDQERVLYIAPQAAKLFHCRLEDLAAGGFLGRLIHPEEREMVTRRIIAFPSRADAAEQGDTIDFHVVAGDGRVLDIRMFVSPYIAGKPIRGILLDMTRQKKLESELHQAQKLESVGRLAAGVAHEINTPVQFVGDSLQFVRECLPGLTTAVDRLQVASRSIQSGAPSLAAAAEADEAAAAADLPYFFDNAPKALDRAVEGLDRVATIVRSLKEFAHPDEKEMSSTDINRAIDSTLTIARNEYKFVADLETDYTELPFVQCHAGEVNQVVLNLVINAAHAIGDVVRGTENRGRITVRTRREDDTVVISIGDTGGGIPETVRDRVFDPFFTTKEVGRGTGQGLAIARSVIVEKHGGDIRFETEIGRGTTFHVQLPIEPRTVAADNPGKAA